MPVHDLTQITSSSGTRWDAASVDSIVHALYDAISGPAGPRDWARLRGLFLPGAVLFPRPTWKDGQEARVLSLDEFIAHAEPAIRAAGFYEREVARRAEVFGDIAQVWSTYETRKTKDDVEPFARGINSILLIQARKRWWVASMAWDDEHEGNRIPQQYVGEATRPMKTPAKE